MQICFQRFQLRKKEAFKSSKAVMRDHEGSQLIIYHYYHKGGKIAFIEAENVSEGQFS